MLAMPRSPLCRNNAGARQLPRGASEIDAAPAHFPIAVAGWLRTLGSADLARPRRRRGGRLFWFLVRLWRFRVGLVVRVGSHARKIGRESEPAQLPASGRRQARFTRLCLQFCPGYMVAAAV